MADMDGLVAFIEKCLAEDEAAAKAGTQGPWEVLELDGELSIRADQSAAHRTRTEFRHVSEHVYDRTDADHIARWDPARVLAEIAAKRRTLALAAEMRQSAAASEYWGLLDMADELERQLAAPYAGRPGWKDDWAIA